MWRGTGSDGVPEATWAVADAEANAQRGALLALLYRYQFERAEIHWRAFGGTHFDLGVLTVGKVARVRAVVLNTSAYTLRPSKVSCIGLRRRRQRSSGISN